MPCEIHNWWFGTPCPGCAKITAAVTKTASDPAPLEPEPLSGVETLEIAPEPVPEDPDPLVPPPNDEELKIPDFLRRNPDNTFMFPGEPRELKPLQQAPPVRVEDIRALPDAELQERLYSDIPLIERQSYLREATRREKKDKAYKRLDSAGFLKSKDRDPQPE